MRKRKSSKESEVAVVQDEPEKPTMLQAVIITFKDGTTASFTGPAVVFENNKKVISDVKFTPPRPLPSEYTWGKF
jgi:hypothetical protein